MAKYGIKHDNGKVLALSKFENNIVPVSFVKIIEADYLRWLDGLKINPFATYDEVKNTLTYSAVRLANAKSASEKDALREELKNISIELDLQTRMGEDTTDAQNDFDAKKLLWQAL